MKLILRKNDSATSLLLFVYNNYMTRTTKDSIKLSSLLEILKVFGKNETAIRMSLSRAVKAGLLTSVKNDSDVSYRLTPEGKESILQWNKGMLQFFKRYQLRHAQWDNQWYFVQVELLDEEKETKEAFIDGLGQYGFARFSNNAWLTPYHQYEEFQNLIEKYHLADKTMEIYGEMKIGKEMDRFLDEVYGIDKLKAAYQGFINDYGARRGEISQLCKEKNFVENGSALPMLHELGFSFFDIASADAALPKQILPQWAGDEAVSIMHELRGQLLEATYGYLEKFV